MFQKLVLLNDINPFHQSRDVGVFEFTHSEIEASVKREEVCNIRHH